MNVGETVLAEAVDAFQDALGDRLLAAYALGSLAHGGFSPLVSDIDLGLIVRDPLRPDDAETIQAVADAQKTNGSELSERLSLFWATESTLRGEQEGGRLPALDRLDLIENGRLLAGTDARNDLPRPSADELVITGAEFALDFLAGVRGAGGPPTKGLGSMRPAEEDAVQEIRSPELLLAGGVRQVTKLVLFPVRFLFTAVTGRVGTNDAAVAHYLADGEGPSTTLAAAALAWRTLPPADDEVAAELLREQMVRFTSTTSTTTSLALTPLVTPSWPARSRSGGSVLSADPTGRCRRREPVFHARDQKLTRLVTEWDCARALADPGLAPEADS